MRPKIGKDISASSLYSYCILQATGDLMYVWHASI
jgi:hypothetical protein